MSAFRNHFTIIFIFILCFYDIYSYSLFSEPLCFSYGECTSLIDSHLSEYFNLHKRIKDSKLSPYSSIESYKHLDSVNTIITYLLIQTPTYNEQSHDSKSDADNLPTDDQIKYLQILKILHDMARLTYHLKFIEDHQYIMKALLDRLKMLQSCCNNIPINSDMFKSMKDSSMFNRNFIHPTKQTQRTSKIIENKTNIKKTIEKEIKFALKDIDVLGIDGVEVKIDDLDAALDEIKLDIDELDIDNVEIVIEEIEINANDDQNAGEN